MTPRDGLERKKDSMEAIGGPERRELPPFQKLKRDREKEKKKEKSWGRYHEKAWPVERNKKSSGRGESGWCSDVTSTHGAWRHAGVRFLLLGDFKPSLQHHLLGLNNTCFSW